MRKYFDDKEFQWIILLHVQSKNYHLISNQANEDLRIQLRS